ncbi:MAG: single-stranded DNA-binding protein [Oscillospiraceae bacterium]|jgi:primosomal replication protein N|nr:single-stranded DNA-binding protein [Oscillospiraceae bacterium]
MNAELKNSIKLCGTVCAAPVANNNSGFGGVVSFPVEISRLSGTVDRLNVHAPESLAAGLDLAEGGRVKITGEVRSQNEPGTDGRSRLIIFVFADEIDLAESELRDENEVELIGVICKEPTFRSTPSGRKICDVMLAINRPRGKSNYLPAIAWGRCAYELSDCTVGTVISLYGRLQSRKYIKKHSETFSEERTAFEISAITVNTEV